MLIGCIGCEPEDGAERSDGTLVGTTDDERDKWNAHIDVNNLVQKRVYEAMTAYPKAFGGDEVLNRDLKDRDRADFFNAIRADRSAPGILDHALRFSAKSPQAESDQAAAKLLSSLKSLWADMVAYSENKEYIDDNYAKADERHPRIPLSIRVVEAAFPAFVKP